MSAEALTIVLGLLTLAQIAVSALSWYVSVQVRMLRLELVTTIKCDDRHDKLDTKVSSAINDISAIKATVCGLPSVHSNR